MHLPAMLVLLATLLLSCSSFRMVYDCTEFHRIM